MTYTYIEKGRFAMTDKPKPKIQDPTDAIVRVTLGSICTSDCTSSMAACQGGAWHHRGTRDGGNSGRDRNGSEGTESRRPRDGERGDVLRRMFLLQAWLREQLHSPHGGWALGCRIDGGQTEYVRVPLATQGLNRHFPTAWSDEQALFVGDVLATGYWAARISEITEEDTVLIIVPVRQASAHC